MGRHRSVVARQDSWQGRYVGLEGESEHGKTASDSGGGEDPDRARREKVSEQSIGRWKAEFLEAGKTSLGPGRNGPTSREEQLEAEVVDLPQALGETAVELRVWKKSAEAVWALRGHRGDPRRVGHADLEVLPAHRHA